MAGGSVGRNRTIAELEQFVIDSRLLQPEVVRHIMLEELQTAVKPLQHCCIRLDHLGSRRQHELVLAHQLAAHTQR